MKLPISIFIITRNEEARIGRTIEAVRDWVAEVIVVDSGSTDETVAIAKALGAKTFHRDWTGYGPQKRFAEDQCSQDWWFNIDADEVVTPPLREELQSLFLKGEPSPCAFKVRIPYVYPGNEKPRPYRLRLQRRTPVSPDCRSISRPSRSMIACRPGRGNHCTAIVSAPCAFCSTELVANDGQGKYKLQPQYREAC